MSLSSSDDDAGIHAALHRYASAIDERRWALLDEVFTADAAIDFTAVGAPDVLSRSAFRAWLEGSIGQVPVTRHHLTNIRVEVDGDAARSTTYLHNPLADDTGRVFLTIGGTYEDRWTSTDDRWLIVGRTFTPTWFDGELPDGITIGGR